MKLKKLPHRSKASPDKWTKEEMVSWLSEAEVPEMAEMLNSAADLHLLAVEWKQSAKIMKQWTLAIMKAKCESGDRAIQVVDTFEKALQSLYPE